jgi:hypothetical protein
VSSRLSDAVVRYFSRGRSPFPQEDPAAITALGPDGAALLEHVRALRSEVYGYEVDSATTDLAGSWDAVVARLSSSHPELSQAAKETLAWAFTYAMR